MTVTVDEYRQVGAVVAAWKQPLLLTHARPDGDALGCLVTMRSILRSLGAKPTTLVYDPVPENYRFLVDDDVPSVLGVDVELGDLQEIDGALIMDTCTYNQLEPVADWLREATCRKVVIDHHVTRDALADVYVIDERASAACVLLYEWAAACRQELDSVAVRALFTGIATDTGWFRFSNCDARSLEIAGDLVRRGVTPEAIYKRLFESQTASRVRLFAAALGAMELTDNDRVAVLPLTVAMFTATGTSPADTENLVNEALKIDSVRVAVLLAESGDGMVKASFRSKDDFDVAALAAEFGGGGHLRASGARIKGTLAEVKEQIHEKLKI